jgi:hypothetical protein
MNAKHRKTLHRVFAEPAKADVAWSDIEQLLIALGAEISEGKGSRVRVQLGETRAVFHRPHPQPVTDRGALRSVRRFLVTAGVQP